jgi:hypothetical protein
MAPRTVYLDSFPGRVFMPLREGPLDDAALRRMVRAPFLLAVDRCLAAIAVAHIGTAPAPPCLRHPMGSPGYNCWCPLSLAPGLLQGVRRGRHPAVLRCADGSAACRRRPAWLRHSRRLLQHARGADGDPRLPHYRWLPELVVCAAHFSPSMAPQASGDSGCGVSLFLPSPPAVCLPPIAHAPSRPPPAPPRMGSRGNPCAGNVEAVGSGHHAHARACVQDALRAGAERRGHRGPAALPGPLRPLRGAAHPLPGGLQPPPRPRELVRPPHCDARLRARARGARCQCRGTRRRRGGRWGCRHSSAHRDGCRGTVQATICVLVWWAPPRAVRSAPRVDRCSLTPPPPPPPPRWWLVGWGQEGAAAAA